MSEVRLDGYLFFIFTIVITEQAENVTFLPSGIWEVKTSILSSLCGILRDGTCRAGTRGTRGTT